MQYHPIIILGMHRSGTTLIARCLEELGVFLGAKKEANDEALFFINLNNWMLRETNACWDNPYNFQFINDNIRGQVLRVIEMHLSNFFTRKNFLGWAKVLRYKDIRQLDIPWGWKDPRNTFTIDIWKEVFPEAKVLHIYRNPIDVARSLQKREQEECQKTDVGLKKTLRNSIKEFFASGTVTYQPSVRVEHIYEGIKLWEEYVKKAFSLEDIFNDKILHIRFESFLEKPADHLKTILDFLKLNLNTNNVINSINPDRKFVFLKNGELLKIYNEIKNKELLKKLDYHRL